MTAARIGVKRSASVVWSGGLKDGKGLISTESGSLVNARCGFAGRFGEEWGANPEELIAAAHAACFSMALAGKLGFAQLSPEVISTQAHVTLEKLEAGYTVTAVHLSVSARVPGAAPGAFAAAAEKAKAGCPISRLLGAAAKITMDAKLLD